MALPEILVSDFKGYVKIVANEFKEADIDVYIETFREQYLRHILGDGAFQDIGNEARAKWNDLLNGAYFETSDGVRRYTSGVKKALIYFIFFEYIRDNYTQTQPGAVKTLGENSTRATDLEVMNIARTRYNAGVLNLNASTQAFLEANEYFAEVVTGSVDNADNTYTLSLPLTKYLEADEVVNLGGNEYVVTAATENVNVTIDAGQTGLDFTGDLITWEPFAAVEFCPIDTAPL